MQERVWIVQIHQVVELRIFVSRMTIVPEGGFLEKIRIPALVVFLIARVSATKLLLASTILL